MTDRIDRLLACYKAGTVAAKAEAARIVSKWRNNPPSLYTPRRSSIQFDRDRDLDERGITTARAYADEHPHQSGATSRNY